MISAAKTKKQFVSTVRTRQWKANMVGLAMVSPWLIGFILFTLGPIVISVVISFMHWNLLAEPKYAGLANYNKMLFEDQQVWKSVWLTTYYSIVSVPLLLVFGFLLALLLNRNIRGLSMWRTVYYLPSIISGVAVALLWEWIFSADFGVLNYLLNLLFGLDKINWLGDTNWVIPSLIMMSVWTVGSTMVINLAGLQNIPTSLYEAAKVDGAGAFRQMINITIPMMTPIIFLNLIVGLINSFQTFTNAYVMTGGGPNKASMFYMLYLYIQSFESFNMGYAAALAWMLFVYIMFLTLIVFISGRYWVHYEGGDGKR
jgi:multiple sugar transport system permease protein